MGRLSGKDRVAANEIRHLAQTLKLGREDFRESLVEAIADATGALHGVSFLPQYDGEQLIPSPLFVSGPRASMIKGEFLRWTIAQRGRWTHYDPLRPAPAERNRVVAFRDIADSPYARNMLQGLFPRVGIVDQVRVLICEGSSLLAWVGVAHDDQLEPSVRRVISAIVPDIRHRFVLERRLGYAALSRAALEAALDAIGSAAYVVSRQGSVRWANSAGRLRLARARDARGLVAAMRGSLASPEAGGYDLVRLQDAGLPPHFLAIERSAASRAGRVSLAGMRWRLTARETEVLGLVASGFANKAIAARLGCAPSTIEVHVSRILSKAGVGSRAQLISMLLSSPSDP
ncbi:MAG: helix-turn-helix transcriptional regulator [Deltaproteobacteria bacterium]|nr:helix-turn-helix transcriptional regulator [Deltaproteobacteria bacterium]